MDTSVEKEGQKQGRKRVRTKGLQKKLQEQIEFYFGDSNLPKDKFLQQKIKEHPDGYISVETIASFNKMKNLTSDLSLIVQVMKRTNLVELSVDEKRVRRAKPLPVATNVDNRTIYVEHIPQSSTHESIRKLFRVFGNITYVSLPRHKSSNAVKGFCFIEFSTVQEAKAALEYFQSGTKPITPSSKSWPGRAPTSTSEEEEKKGEEGTAVQRETAEGEEGEEEKEEEEEKGDEVEEEGKEVEEEKRKEEEEEKDEKSLGKKRRRDADTEDGFHGDVEEGKLSPEAKRVRRNGGGEGGGGGGKGGGGGGEGGGGEELAKVTQDEARGTKDVEGLGEGVRGEEEEGRGEGVEREEGGQGNTAEETEEPPSRKRKREEEEEKAEGEEVEEPTAKTQRLDSQSSDLAGGEGEEGGKEGGQKKGKKKNRQHKKKDWEAALKSLQLRVMAKTEWLEMREIFHSMQKEKVKEMKQQLRESSKERGSEGKGFVAQCLVKVEGVGGGEGEEKVTIEKLQEVCSKYGTVAYTDIQEGSSEGYIRYASSGCVEQLVKGETLPHVTFTPVPEEEERAYYLKTVASRKQLAKSKRGKKKRNIRGQDKIISKALQKKSHTAVGGKSEKEGEEDRVGGGGGMSEPTHIRFSDSEHES